MQKDEKHSKLVEKNGGVFIPLVVESYVLWTPFAKKTLKYIALRTIENGNQELVRTVVNKTMEL